VVSIGHRSTLRAFHQRNAALAPDGDHFALGSGAATALEHKPAG
jgi:putative ATP-binding cassette transporter